MLDQAGRVIETILFFLLMLLWVVIATVDRAIETNSILHPPFPARATLSFVYQGERYDFSRIDMMRKKAFPSGDSGWQLDHSQITVPLHDGSALIATSADFDFLTDTAQRSRRGARDTCRIGPMVLD
jgi:hypothetical protein